MSLFESPKFLISQTRENLCELDLICREFLTRSNGRRVVEKDPVTGNKTFKIIFRELIPAKARHIVATAVNDLRHALDQATCAIVGAVTGADLGLIYFPIATNPNDLQGRVGKFPIELGNVFLGFQSYPPGVGYLGGNAPICSLAKAAQRKHRVSCGLSGRVSQMAINEIRVTEKIDFRMPPDWDPVKNEMMLAITGPDGNLNYDVKLEVFMAFYDAGPLTGEPVEACLRALLLEVETIVSALEAEASRILAGRL